MFHALPDALFRIQHAVSRATISGDRSVGVMILCNLAFFHEINVNFLRIFFRHNNFSGYSPNLIGKVNSPVVVITGTEMDFMPS